MDEYKESYTKVKLLDIREVDMGSLGVGDKINRILISFQLVVFSTFMVILNFVVLAISQLLIRENIKAMHTNTTLKQVQVGLSSIVFGINSLFMLEFFLQITMGYGPSYLLSLWSGFDALVIITLFALEIASRAGWKDPTSSIWHFLIVLRLIRVLALMSQHTSSVIAEKREERLRLEDQIVQLRERMRYEDENNVKLKNDLQSAVLHLCKLEKSLVYSRENAKVLLRRYSMA